MFALQFLFQNKTILLIFMLLLICIGEYAYIVKLKSDNTAIVAEKNKIETLLSVSQATVMQLKTDINIQNDSIEKWRKDADVRAAKSAEEVKNATKAASNSSAFNA